jgi:hypothetical protein
MSWHSRHEQEVTVQVAMLVASGMHKNPIINALGIDLREYEMAAYRIRAITKDWLRK